MLRSRWCQSGVEIIRHPSLLEGVAWRRLFDLDFSRSSLMHRKVQLESSITPAYDTNSEATTLLTNISLVRWVDVIRQEDRSIG